jgi:hypothetical protein
MKRDLRNSKRNEEEKKRKGKESSIIFSILGMLAVSKLNGKRP